MEIFQALKCHFQKSIQDRWWFFKGNHTTPYSVPKTYIFWFLVFFNGDFLAGGATASLVPPLAMAMHFEPCNFMWEMQSCVSYISCLQIAWTWSWKKGEILTVTSHHSMMILIFIISYLGYVLVLCRLNTGMTHSMKICTGRKVFFWLT